ncbi:MAG TPA: hypothetical protein VLT58_05930, partial [Polyangia bacterium]|nr:hypothetical protein [Polyangia bacterium]
MRQIGWQHVHQVQPLRRGQRRQRLDDSRDLRAEIQVLGVDLHVSRLDARQIQNVVDEVQEPLPVAFDHLQIAALVDGQRAGHPVPQQLRQRQHGVQRRPDLVAHVGDERALEPLRLLAAAGLRLQ